MNKKLSSALLALVCTHVLTTHALAADTPPPTELPKMTVNDIVDGEYTALTARSTAKLDTPILLTPMSIQTVPAQVLDDQQAVRLDTAVVNVSGVTPIESSGSAYGLASGTMLLGFVVAVLSVTGIYIWWKKRKSRNANDHHINHSVEGD
jgi:outer membrane receptor for monomeric catechols